MNATATPNPSRLFDHEELTKGLFIDAIMGSGVALSATKSDALVKAGVMEFTGNQWNENWQWKRSALKEYDLSDLQDLYLTLKSEARNAG